MLAPSDAPDKAQSAGLRRLPAATRYAFAGLRSTFLREAAFRQEVLAALVLLPIALMLGRTAFERVVLIAALVLVLVVELLNSAIEAVVDLVSPERHPLAGIAKDAGAAAVFLAILACAGIWGVVLWA